LFHNPNSSFAPRCGNGAFNAARKGSAEHRMLERELTGLRYSYEEAGPIIEDLDPFGWGGTCRPLPETVKPIQPLRK
jgi:hypothetical protein